MSFLAATQDGDGTSIFIEAPYLDSQGPGKKNADCSSHMTVSSMVPNPCEDVNRETTSFTTPPRSSIEAVLKNLVILTENTCVRISF